MALPSSPEEPQVRLRPGCCGAPLYCPGALPLKPSSPPQGVVFTSRITLPEATHSSGAEVLPDEGRCFSFSFNYIWQESGRILDTISAASAKNLQEVVDFNIQDSGHSDCIRERPESFGHPSPEEKRKEQSYKTEEHRDWGRVGGSLELQPPVA